MKNSTSADPETIIPIIMTLLIRISNLTEYQSKTIMVWKQWCSPIYLVRGNGKEISEDHTDQPLCYSLKKNSASNTVENLLEGEFYTRKYILKYSWEIAKHHHLECQNIKCLSSDYQKGADAFFRLEISYALSLIKNYFPQLKWNVSRKGRIFKCNLS